MRRRRNGLTVVCQRRQGSAAGGEGGDLRQLLVPPGQTNCMRSLKKPLI